MEVQDNDCLPFLDVLITKKEDGSLAHQVYQKKTHTDKYVHASSHHPLSQKLGILHILATRAVRTYNKEHLEDELSHLSKTLLDNGYERRDIIRAFRREMRGTSINNKYHNTRQGGMGRDFLPLSKE